MNLVHLQFIHNSNCYRRHQYICKACTGSSFVLIQILQKRMLKDTKIYNISQFRHNPLIDPLYFLFNLFNYNQSTVKLSLFILAWTTCRVYFQDSTGEYDAYLLLCTMLQISSVFNYMLYICCVPFSINRIHFQFNFAPHCLYFVSLYSSNHITKLFRLNSQMINEQ